MLPQEFGGLPSRDAEDGNAGNNVDRPDHARADALAQRAGREHRAILVVQWRMRAAWIAVAALAGASCASPQWAKKDTAGERVQDDLRACEDAAFNEANAVRQPYPTMGPVILQDSSGRRFNVYPVGPFADPYAERFMRQGRLARDCMRKKGYELVPAEAKRN